MQIINSPNVSQDMAKYLVMVDDAVTTFIIWRPEQRISFAEKIAVQKWFEKKTSFYFWCNKNISISYMFFGAIKDKMFSNFTKRTFINHAFQDERFIGSEYNFVTKCLQPIFNHEFKCEQLNNTNIYKLGSIYNKFEAHNS